MVTAARHRLAALLGLAWLAEVARVTLRSAPRQALVVSRLHWYCVLCGTEGIADVLLNVILFAPFGLLARIAGWSWRRVAIVFTALSIAIEVAQRTVLVGRDASLGDVLSNGGGALLGWAVLPWLICLGRPDVRVAQRAARALLIVMAMIWLLSAIALRPAIATNSEWRGDLRPVGWMTQPFAGTVEEAVLDGTPIHDGVVTPVQAASGSFDLVLEITRDDSAPAWQPAPLLHVTRRAGPLLFDATQVSEELMAEIALRGNRWLLHSPKWTYPGALEIPAHRRWTFHWTWKRGTLTLVSGPSDGSSPQVAFTRTLSVASGWLLIHPFVTVVGDHAGLWTSLWLAWWFGMLGWLAGFLPRIARWGYGALALATFAAALYWGGLARDPWTLLVAAAAFAAAALAGMLRARQGAAARIS